MTSTQKKNPLQVLQQTSRTFYIPIVKLPQVVQQAVASAYLCLRAIDQVQDHPTLANNIKSQILKNISYSLQTFTPTSTINSLRLNWGQNQKDLPEVSKRLVQWIFYCPQGIRARVVDTTASMADRMAFWADKNWKISNQQDLNAYTFAVAGAVGLILCQIWQWYEGSKTDRSLAIGYGRGLQSVNILRNSSQDRQRGVSFYPPNWTQQNMIQYSKKNLIYATQYMNSLKQGSAAKIFCEIPYALATATVDLIQKGGNKLSRQMVKMICKI